MLKWAWAFSLGFGFSFAAQGAPCCAGSNSVPALITGDEASFLSIGLSTGSTLADAPAKGQGLPVFRDDLSAKESRQALVLNYSKLLDGDRWQAGATLPVFVNSLENAGHRKSQASLGDVSCTLGYEAVPEWEYSEWKPRVFTFVQGTFPSGKSIYQSNGLLFSDVGGLGQYQGAMGAVAIKRWSRFDANFVLKLARIFSRSFSSASAPGTDVDSSYGISSSLGIGYSFAERLRFGLSLAPEYQSSYAVASGRSLEQTSFKLAWNTGLSLTYLAGLNDSLVLGYNDQTWVGPAFNTALLRTASLSFTHRIER